MSKLWDRLERAASAPSRPLGFSLGNRETLAPLALVAHLKNSTAKAANAAIKAGAEFVLIDGPSAVKSPPSLGDTPWGARVDGLADTEISTLREAGCDFLFVSLGGTPVRLLSDESLGSFSVVPADLDDRRLRAIERLPFEGSVIEADIGDTLTVSQAVDYAAAASRLSGHLLAWSSLSWGAEEMAQLRDMGFGGVVCAIGDAREALKIANVRDAIRAVPAPFRRRRDRAVARVPQLGSASAVPDSDDDDDFDDE